MGNNKALNGLIAALTLVIMLSSLWLGYSIQKVERVQVKSNVFSMPEVANYLSMSESDVSKIIATELQALEIQGSYSGMMFPYFEVNGKRYFYKDKVDEWLKEASKNHLKY